MTGRRQAEILNWAEDTFGPVALDPYERICRFIEEAIELAHAAGLDHVVLQAIIKRVWARGKGDVGREVGQAQMTLEALAEVLDFDCSFECESELNRVQSIPKEEWTRRHAAKQKLGIAG